MYRIVLFPSVLIIDNIIVQTVTSLTALSVDSFLYLDTVAVFLHQKCIRPNCL